MTPNVRPKTVVLHYGKLPTSGEVASRPGSRRCVVFRDAIEFKCANVYGHD